MASILMSSTEKTTLTWRGTAWSEGSCSPFCRPLKRTDKQKENIIQQKLNRLMLGNSSSQPQESINNTINLSQQSQIQLTSSAEKFCLLPPAPFFGAVMCYPQGNDYWTCVTAQGEKTLIKIQLPWKRLRGRLGKMLLASKSRFFFGF